MKLCGMGFADLTRDSGKFLGIHFSYKRNIESKENFSSLLKKLRLFGEQQT